MLTLAQEPDEIDFDLFHCFFIWLADLLCGTCVLWVTIGSIRRTCSIWSFTVARRCKRWTSLECSLYSSTFALATRRDSLHPPEVQRHRLDRNTCAHIPDGGVRCVTWNTRGLIGSPTSSQLSREQKHISFTRLAENNDVICLQEVHGKDEFFQAVQILVPQFRLFGTLKPNNLNAGGSAICIHKKLFLDGAVISHVITCQGRDHIVSIHSGDSILVTVNVHFEPDLTLWGAFVNDYALFFHIGLVTLEHLVLWLENVNICEPEQGRFNVLNQTFMDGDAGKTAVFSCFFSHVFEIAQLDFTRKDVTVNGVIRTCPELTGYLLIFLWLRHVIFIGILMSSKILVNVPSRGFTASSCPTLLGN